MRQLNEFQWYFVHEFVDAYKHGEMSRRDMMRRVMYITGGIASAASLLASMGVARAALAQPAPPTGAQASPSPLSVAPDDPAIQTSMISFQNLDDGATIQAYEARPAGASGPLPVILVCHQNMGLEPHIQDVVRRWAKLGYLTSGLDLLSREGGTPNIDRAQAPALLSAAGGDRHVSDFASAAGYYADNPDADAERIGMNGFCFGGSITWRSTEVIPLKAAVPFYGGAPPIDQVPNIRAAVLGVYSSDPNDNANANRDRLEEALTASGVTHRLTAYPGTRHGFYGDAGAAYNPEQALVAWNDATTWMGQYL